MSVLERFHCIFSDMWFYSYVGPSWFTYVMISHDDVRSTNSVINCSFELMWMLMICLPWSQFVSEVFCWVVRSVSSHLLTCSLVVPTPRLFTVSPLSSSLPGEGVWFGKSTSMSGQEIQTSLWLRQTVWCLSCAGSGEEKGAIGLPHQIKGWVSLVALLALFYIMCAIMKEGKSVASTRFWLMITPW